MLNFLLYNHVEIKVLKSAFLCTLFPYFFEIGLSWLFRLRYLHSTSETVSSFDFFSFFFSLWNMLDCLSAQCWRDSSGVRIWLLLPSCTNTPQAKYPVCSVCIVWGTCYFLHKTVVLVSVPASCPFAYYRAAFLDLPVTEKHLSRVNIAKLIRMHFPVVSQ